ncbi:MAG TPA: oligoendopeptidase F [Bacteroidota bacterium]|nr:oligoendopeptidase F [Bacteroidota bacterium]
MNPLRDVTLCILGLSLAASSSSLSQQRDRSKIPESYRWNLADLYPTDDAWLKAKEAFAAKIGSPEKENDGVLKQFDGKLSESPQTLLACLNLSSDLGKEYARLSVYASMASDQDTRDPKYLQMVQAMGQIGSTFGAKSAFIEPELLKMGKAKLGAFIAAEPKLAVYRQNIDDVLRREAHTGSQEVEKIIADAGLMADGPDNIYGIFSNAEFPYPSVTLSDGKTVKLDKAAFTLYRAVPNREDRKKVFQAFFGKINEFRATFGTQLYAEVKKDMFYARARKYNSSVESALDGSNIPVAVYTSLVNSVNSNLGTFHRYLRLRARMMGLDQLHYYDLYGPLVKHVDIDYTYEEAEKLVLASLAPLGEDYIAVARKGFADRWLDVYPSTGKRSGAYSQGAAYDVHPYMLLNYNGKYDDVSTLAHEFGHTMHSYLSNSSQPYPTSQYSIFVAEVASTFNEALLMDYMLKTIKDDDVRLTLLGSYLDGLRGTLFRQTQFAEFELRIHEMAEKGETLTGDVLDKLYMDITKRYYGSDAGVCIVDDEIKAEWAYIPHFYYNFYVFQYATSLTASGALSEEVLAGDKDATRRYLQLLRSGSSDYPIALLKKAGIDMTTTVPFDLAMKKMNRVMDEVEKILDSRKK